MNLHEASAVDLQTTLGVVKPAVKTIGRPLRVFGNWWTPPWGNPYIDSA